MVKLKRSKRGILFPPYLHYLSRVHPSLWLRCAKKEEEEKVTHMHRLKCDSVIPFTPLCETVPPSFDKSVLLWSRNKQPDFSGSEMMLFTARSHFASVSIYRSRGRRILIPCSVIVFSLLNWFHGTDFTVSYQLWKLMAAPFGKAA